MFKLMTIDLDGTLLNSFGEVSENTRKALLEAKARGTEVVLASGRPISSTESLAVELGVDNYLISGNGAAVYDIKEQKVIYDRFLSKEQVMKIAKLCDENSFFYNVYTEDEVIASSLNYNVLFYHKENVKKIEERRTHINVVQNIMEYIEQSGKEKFLKITVCDESQFIFNSIMKRLKEINGIDVLETAYMSRKKIKDGTDDVDIQYYYTEITNENVNKWSAIEFLLDKLNIRPEEVISIGDNLNDKEMIENAGLGVVMGNSNPIMKGLADEIVADNNSEGVLEAINRFVLN
ncbi:MAG: HAD family phosphatase [Clostridia bacterium]|nr:HAD family phosphatase [Clostridia bacterium]